MVTQKTKLKNYFDFINCCSPTFPYLTEKAYIKIVNLKSEYEQCGVIRKGEFVELINHSKHNVKALIDTNDLEQGDIIFHTHVGENINPVFSNRDILTSKRSGIPSLLFHTTFKEFDYYDPQIPHPYPLKLKKTTNLIEQDFIKLPYQYIRSDCYSYCRDVAQAIYNKKLPDIYNKIQSLSTMKYFFRHPEQLGFYRVLKPKIGCFALMQLSPSIPYHMGIITDISKEGDITMLHQLSEDATSDYRSLNDLKDNLIGIYDISQPGELPYFPPVKDPDDIKSFF